MQQKKVRQKLPKIRSIFSFLPRYAANITCEERNTTNSGPQRDLLDAHR